MQDAVTVVACGFRKRADGVVCSVDDDQLVALIGHDTVGVGAVFHEPNPWNRERCDVLP